MKFKRVQINPARIPPQQDAAKRLVSLMRMRQVRVATYLNELIKRNQPSAEQPSWSDLNGPVPTPELEAALVE